MKPEPMSGWAWAGMLWLTTLVLTGLVLGVQALWNAVADRDLGMFLGIVWVAFGFALTGVDLAKRIGGKR